MATVRDTVTELYENIIIQSGPKKGGKFKPKTVERYVGAFMTVFDSIGDCAFDAELLEEYLEEIENVCTRRTYVNAVNHYVRNSDFSEDEKAEMQLLNDMICKACNDAKKWGTGKLGLQIKYRAVPFKDLLMSLAEGARKKADDGTGDYSFILERVRLAFTLIAMNPPLRTDYCNIILKDRVESIPPKTPYYHDGKLYFPEGSRIKTGNASPTLDIGECRGLIEDFVAHHPSQYLFGSMTNNAFSRMLLEESFDQLGVSLGIRFFRTKYSTDKRKRTRAANQQFQVMDHSMATDVGSYALPVEFEGEMEMDGEIEAGDAVEPNKMSLSFICS